MKTLAEANKVVHPVHTQWHYPILSRAGFEPVTKEAVGFVRQYIYEKADGHRIMCATGASADHWEDWTTPAYGYWSSLEPHVAKL